MLEEVETLEKEQQAAAEILDSKKGQISSKERCQIFPPEKCFRLVDRYKQLYKLSKEETIQPFYLYHMVVNGYTAAYEGYVWYHELCPPSMEYEKMMGEFKVKRFLDSAMFSFSFGLLVLSCVCKKGSLCSCPVEIERILYFST